jgi:hypothetical protein
VKSRKKNIEIDMGENTHAYELVEGHDNEFIKEFSIFIENFTKENHKIPVDFE